MAKVQHISGISKRIPFEGIDFYDLFRVTFENSELGRMKRLLPPHELAVNFGLVSKPVIEPKYSHAWIFSDGLASVDDGGRIKFIDTSGKVVIDQIPYVSEAEGYVFHNNRCIVHNEHCDRFGLLDKQGNYIIQRYDHSGEIINDFYINDVSYMTYESDELRYSTSKEYNEEGAVTSETEDIEPLPVEKMAKCRRYEAESGWYGLMTADGKVITPPSYCSIQAIGYDMYLCKDNDEDGVILNGKGETTKK